jgi:hypothetical protein
MQGDQELEAPIAEIRDPELKRSVRVIPVVADVG